VLYVSSPTSTTDITMGVSGRSWYPQVSAMITSCSSKCAVPRPESAVGRTARNTDKVISAFDACELSYASVTTADRLLLKVLVRAIRRAKDVHFGQRSGVCLGGSPRKDATEISRVGTERALDRKASYASEDKGLSLSLN
jgi:hypothetical protein